MQDTEIPSRMESNGRRKSIHKKTGERFTERIDNKVIAALILWYFWSGCTLFLNKYLIGKTDGDATLLSKFLEFRSFLCPLHTGCCISKYNNLENLLDLIS